jgi:hypothetical protein
MQRAAILIGVSKTEGLPELQAVEAGIAQMLAWAAAQHIDGDRLVALTDKRDKVRTHQVADAMTQACGGQLRQFVPGPNQGAAKENAGNALLARICQ